MFNPLFIFFAGCWAVDAPVSGGDIGARDGKLAILGGGCRGSELVVTFV